MRLIILIVLSIVSISCNSQEKKEKSNTLFFGEKEETDSQIGEYVTSAFEDAKGNLWFGTIAMGIAKYDGNQLTYFTKKDGLPSDRVTSVIEDGTGNYWFNTDEGISKFDGQKFTNFLVKKDDFFSNAISQLLIDSKGEFWVGTWGGVYKFDGSKFTLFEIPYPKVATTINKDTKDWITGIKEDAEGNMWFTRDGYGACKYDGKSFTHFLKKDGLHSNNVTEIQIDTEGHIWLGTRVAEMDTPNPNKRFGRGGLNKLANNTILSFPDIKGLNKGDVHELYKDEVGNIWIGTKDNGVYKYDGEKFINFDVPISVMGMVEDKNGNLWMAGAGGLYKINQKEEVINVTTKGPWK